MEDSQSSSVYPGGNIGIDNQIWIRDVSYNEEKMRIMEACDGAFPIRLFERPDREAVIYKIMKYAIFYAAFTTDKKIIPIGYVAFYANDKESRTAYISNIGVDAAYQRHHIGSRLMKISLDTAKKNGMEIMRLEVLKTNKKAVSFYRHWGFTFESKGAEDTYYMSRCL